MDYFLSKGSHSSAGDGRCAMEWVSFLAGERHSDPKRRRVARDLHGRMSRENERRPQCS
jgi:hypothetical protein